MTATTLAFSPMSHLPPIPHIQPLCDTGEICHRNVRTVKGDAF
jgi:hypothetical protein